MREVAGGCGRLRKVWGVLEVPGSMRRDLAGFLGVGGMVSGTMWPEILLCGPVGTCLLAFEGC